MTLNFGNLGRGIAFAVPFCLLISIQARGQFSDVEIIWDNSMAAGIVFMLDDSSDSEVPGIYLNGSQTPILGKIEKAETSYSIIPVIPFTAGLTYQIKSEDKIIYEISHSKF